MHTVASHELYEPSVAHIGTKQLMYPITRGYRYNYGHFLYDETTTQWG